MILGGKEIRKKNVFDEKMKNEVIFNDDNDDDEDYGMI